MAREEWAINVAGEREVNTNRQPDEQRWQRRCIYKLPASVTNLNKNAYTPQVISFGPYHRKNEDLKPMEEHKDRALSQFLSKFGKTRQSCLDLLKHAAQELKDAYDPMDEELQQDTDAFLMIMVRDGCFMLEIFRASTGDFEGYAKNDPVFSEHGKLYVFPHIWRDLMMLENQLPMKVLYMLLQFQKGLATENQCCPISPDIEKTTDKLVYQFLFSGSTSEAPSNCLHILHMHRKVLLGSSSENDKQKNTTTMPMFCGGTDIIRSAMELDEAGITIKKSNSHSIKDIAFEKGLCKGVLSLPMIIVDDSTEPLYLNLMAFERFHVGAGNEVTSYVFFMDNMIDDSRDIRLLHSKDIIQNGVGSDKAAAKLFNSLSKDITLDQNSHLGQVYKNVNDYCKKWCPRHRANLFHNYLTSPWAWISVLAAFVLFVLTVTQTVYSVLGFYIPQS